MTRVCMIGNSHVAAMRYAWDEIAEANPGLTVDIFAQHALNLASVELLDDGRLRLPEKPFWHFARNAEAATTRAVNLNHFDVFVLVGLAFGPINVFRTFRRYHFYGLKSKRQLGLTRDNFRKAVWQTVEESAALHVATLIHSYTAKPVLLLETPLASEKGFSDADKPSMQSWRAAAENGDGPALMEIYAEMCAEMKSRNIVLVPQAEETKASAISTLQRFADNAGRTRSSDDVRPEDDYLHMNTAYGEIMWRETIAAIERLGITTRTAA